MVADIVSVLLETDISIFYLRPVLDRSSSLLEMPLFAAVAGEGSGCGVVSALSLPSVLLAVALEQIPDLVGVGLYMQSGILSPSCKCCLWKAPTAH